MREALADLCDRLGTGGATLLGWSIPPIVTLAVFLVAFVALAVAAHSYVSRRTKGADEDDSWRAFRAECRSRKFTPQEEKVLFVMARKCFDHDPTVLLRDRPAFDKAVAMLAAGLDQGEGEAVDRIENVFADLRRDLGYDVIARRARLLSTRELTEGVAVEIVDAADDRAVRGIVRLVKELHFLVEIEGDDELFDGDAAVLTRVGAGGKVWEFENRVVVADHRMLRLAHDHTPEAINRRFFRRVPYRTRVAFSLLPDGPDAAIRFPEGLEQATLTDLSGSGVGMLASGRVRLGRRLLLCLFMDEPQIGPLWCVGEVRRAVETDERYHLGVGLFGISADDEALLVRLVNETLRQMATEGEDDATTPE